MDTSRSDGQKEKRTEWNKGREWVFDLFCSIDIFKVYKILGGGVKRTDFRMRAELIL